MLDLKISIPAPLPSNMFGTPPSFIPEAMFWPLVYASI
ncbi:hypothetical protein AZ78_2723 [Lysobacter capsici AZ78]|uniref:Uncharacterized protein n=1 Tax=Lysobacter capsici AZ78 TaxID=1444315 RepID=A0A108U9R2_9GAMM|nr:hypothetical protein AZ78_2723 [Lysobacter capsici AZ78]